MHNKSFKPLHIIYKDFFEYHHCRDEHTSEIDFNENGFYDICTLISGNVRYVIEGRIYTVDPGDILIANSSQLHHTEVLKSDQVYEYVIVRLYDGFFDHIGSVGWDLHSFFQDIALRNCRHIHPNRIHQAMMISLTNLLEREYHTRQIGYLAASYSTIINIVLLTSRAYFSMSQDSVSKTDENKHVDQAVDYINEHLDEHLTIDDIAKRLYISKSHLSHQFKKYTGYSVYTYITRKRLFKARTLLSQGIPVTAAYTECGFSDYSNFLKVFKREFGYNPSFFLERKGHGSRTQAPLSVE